MNQFCKESQFVYELTHNQLVTTKLRHSTEELPHMVVINQVSEKTKVRVDTYYGQNDVTISLNRSVERCYKRTNNERTMVSKQNQHLVPHDNS